MTHSDTFEKYEVTLLLKPIATHLGIFSAGTEVEVEGYWDDVTGKSWMDSEGNFAALHYAVRSGVAGLPLDNEVVYVKINGLGHLIHRSELL